MLFLGSGPLGSGPTGPGSGYSVMPRPGHLVDRIFNRNLYLELNGIAL